MSRLSLGRVAAIYNPESGGGGHRRELPRLLDLLRSQVSELLEMRTEHPGHAVALARQAVAGGMDAICALGGDGTVNEVINGMAESGLPLLIVPTGTVNVLALELGLPFEPADACRLATLGQLSWIDLGRAGERYFALMAGVGLDAIAAAGSLVEINTSGLRRPAQEPYPSLRLLAGARKRGIGITFGSDAHRAQDVAAGFAEALALAESAGYTASVRLSDRAEVPLP